ncbi:hypothetical protein Aph01nite_19200 [Acrocarpospora phusangensis]|uniref:Uncharacterized protein n=1 Tax=Acrocarpospora phusangensis TaxID=1070424 RepID=A0A919QA81_9ACTN|nr:hypothetical protein [Acrocarpospora phusangensis]GIH23610.1 hypothetical protein Aph01nite_19200 [Acrocarpospora phusangensis]
MSSKTARSPRPSPVRDTPRQNRLRSAIGLAVAVLVAGSLGYLFGAPDATENAIAEMRVAEAKRDVRQITELTSTARTTAADLEKVLAGLAKALPPGGALAAQPPADGEVAEWQRLIKQAVDRHAETPSGTTATNVARGGFRNAVNTMSIALDAYVSCQELSTDVRQRCLDLAARQRSASVMAWSVAATQLDQINVDAGNGHQHVYLTGLPGDGAMMADTLPEGTD